MKSPGTTLKVRRNRRPPRTSSHKVETKRERPVVGIREIERLIAEFESRTLPKKKWDHLAHCRVGLWYVLWLGPDAALDELRERICALNRAHGVANTATSGYHATITRFCVAALAEYVATSKNPEPRALFEGLHRAPLTEKKHVRRFYSKALLASPRARFSWHEPDLKDAPFRDRLGGI